MSSPCPISNKSTCIPWRKMCDTLYTTLSITSYSYSTWLYFNPYSTHHPYRYFTHPTLVAAGCYPPLYIYRYIDIYYIIYIIINVPIYKKYDLYHYFYIYFIYISLSLFLSLFLYFYHCFYLYHYFYSYLYHSFLASFNLVYSYHILLFFSLLYTGVEPVLLD